MDALRILLDDKERFEVERNASDREVGPKHQPTGPHLMPRPLGDVDADGVLVARVLVEVQEILLAGFSAQSAVSVVRSDLRTESAAFGCVPSGDAPHAG